MELRSYIVFVVDLASTVESPAVEIVIVPAPDAKSAIRNVDTLQTTGDAQINGSAIHARELDAGDLVVRGKLVHGFPGDMRTLENAIAAARAHFFRPTG